ncbi:MAG: nucleotidyl transferase AbiEii/AbiGii toxin family protein [Acidimicrobiaceae bacterium]|nr:nucleotidyl transferase AbiEii/AbiGii toxin family protein [Acidimicrobiaceae bacterium]
MIPQSAIQQWRKAHPWRRVVQVEQDLLLETVLHRAAEEGGLEQFVFIGGTCLHKLYGPGPRRYSEDLDFVWTGDGTPDGALDKIADQSRSLGFERVEVVTSAEARYPKVLFFYENYDGLPAKMKLEVNTHLAPSLRGQAIARPLVTVNEWLNEVSDIPCAPLAALAGMKIVAGSTRGKPRDLYDLRYMIADLGVPAADASVWAQKTRPSDWKPARRHRYVQRATRKPAYWAELNGYLRGDEQVQDVDREAMSAVMLDAVAEIQRLDQEAAASRRDTRSSGGGRSGDPPVPVTRYCGHGDRPCRRRVAPGKTCPVHRRPPCGR